MSLVETSYKQLLTNLVGYGSWTHNRTGIDTCFIPAGTIQADLREGFPS